jgi:hypothetical protein
MNAALWKFMNLRLLRPVNLLLLPCLLIDPAFAAGWSAFASRVHARAAAASELSLFSSQAVVPFLGRIRLPMYSGPRVRENQQVAGLHRAPSLKDFKKLQRVHLYGPMSIVLTGLWEGRRWYIKMSRRKFDLARREAEIYAEAAGAEGFPAPALAGTLSRQDVRAVAEASRRAWRTLNHNLIKRLRGRVYVVIAEAPGMKLLDYVDQLYRTLPAAGVERGLLEVMEALLRHVEDVERRGFRHRDMNPYEIFVQARNDGSLLITRTDWALAATAAYPLTTIPRRFHRFGKSAFQVAFAPDRHRDFNAVRMMAGWLSSPLPEDSVVRHWLKAFVEIPGGSPVEALAAYLAQARQHIGETAARGSPQFPFIIQDIFAAVLSAASAHPSRPRVLIPLRRRAPPLKNFESLEIAYSSSSDVIVLIGSRGRHRRYIEIGRPHSLIWPLKQRIYESTLSLLPAPEGAGKVGFLSEEDVAALAAAATQDPRWPKTLDVETFLNKPYVVTRSAPPAWIEGTPSAGPHARSAASTPPFGAVQLRRRFVRSFTGDVFTMVKEDSNFGLDPLPGSVRNLPALEKSAPVPGVSPPAAFVGPSVMPPRQEFPDPAFRKGDPLTFRLYSQLTPEEKMNPALEKLLAGGSWSLQDISRWDALPLGRRSAPHLSKERRDALIAYAGTGEPMGVYGFIVREDDPVVRGNGIHVTQRRLRVGERLRQELADELLRRGYETLVVSSDETPEAVGFHAALIGREGTFTIGGRATIIALREYSERLAERPASGLEGYHLKTPLPEGTRSILNVINPLFIGLNAGEFIKPAAVLTRINDLLENAELPQEVWAAIEGLSPMLAERLQRVDHSSALLRWLEIMWIRALDDPPPLIERSRPLESAA